MGADWGRPAGPFTGRTGLGRVGSWSPPAGRPPGREPLLLLPPYAALELSWAKATAGPWCKRGAWDGGHEVPAPWPGGLCGAAAAGAVWAALYSLSFEQENLLEKMITVDPRDRGR